MVKIGLDVDGVCLSFNTKFTALCAEHGIIINCFKVWNFFEQDLRCYDIFKNLTVDFWLSLEREEQSFDMDFVPTAYISHRNIPTEVTRQSLLRVGFPDAPVIHVTHTEDKVKEAKKFGIDVFVDDRASTVLYFLENHVKAVAINKLWNEDYNVPRIHTLGELNHGLWAV
jgi:hypothetical protein